MRVYAGHCLGHLRNATHLIRVTPLVSGFSMAADKRQSHTDHIQITWLAERSDIWRHLRRRVYQRLKRTVQVCIRPCHVVQRWQRVHKADCRRNEYRSAAGVEKSKNL